MSDAKYKAEAPPALSSTYQAFLEENPDAVGDSEDWKDDDTNKEQDDTEQSKPSEETKSDEAQQQQAVEGDTSRGYDHYFHSWVYVQVPGAAFFVEASTGGRRALDYEGYLGLNCVFNQENYWLSRDQQQKKAEGPPARWKTAATLDLNNNELWIKLVADMDDKKRLLVPLYSWVHDLRVPVDCYELMYRLGQKTEIYRQAKVEYFAPYLMKEGTVQKVQYFKEDTTEDQQQHQKVSHVVEKFRHRKDRMEVRETFPESNRVVEKFSPGRCDRLREHKYFRMSSSHPVEYECRFYSEARQDGLSQRVIKELELVEQYHNRPDRQVCQF